MGLPEDIFNNPELTQEKFIYHPQTHQRLYKTGNRVIAHDQDTLCFIERTDKQLKFAGIRIEAGEIEHSIEQEPLVKKAIVKLHEQTDYYKSLIAYIEFNEQRLYERESNLKNNSGISDYLKTIYDEIYRHAANFKQKDGTNTCGWQSSFTGTVFSAHELSESYRFINSIIQKNDLSQILEIGCGTGSVLLRYIDQAQCYTVIELSDVAINYVSNQLNKEQKEKVIFKNKPALDLNEEKKYSGIIINSVVQYFPSSDYLIKILKKVVCATRDNGTIVIGDVRSLNGKIDRKSLSVPISVDETINPHLTVAILKKTLEGIMGRPVYLDYKFQDQGISSLCAQFFLASINERFGIQIVYCVLGQYNTLSKLANYIDRCQSGVQSLKGKLYEKK